MAHDAGPIEAPTPPGRPVPGIVVRAAELAFPPALCKHRYAGLQYATLPDGYASGNKHGSRKLTNFRHRHLEADPMLILTCLLYTSRCV